ncbi:MAG: polysaccharide deacetylase family protein [Clostridiales bacterium]|jgi:probable sporulation protein (polysaccharide deacetylase family)|nr:polysaccharide deacetylase family protein [Clostridiales bacterium]
MDKEKLFRNVVANLLLFSAVIGVIAVTNSSGIKSVFSGAADGVIYRGNPSKNRVSLMINVYWGTEYIAGMLDILEREGVKATFFVGGSWVAGNEETFMRIYKAGHEIGNHGYFHKDHKQISEARNREEIEVCGGLVERVSGYKMELFAPPSGSFGKITLRVADSLGYKTVLWSKDTVDWRDKDADLVYNRATRKLANGDLILMHPTEHTLKALKKIITTIKEQGFVPTTVSENIAVDGNV